MAAIVGERTLQQRAHPGRNEDQIGTLQPRSAQLLVDLGEERGIALDDPSGDLLVAIPGGVLHEHAADLFSQPRSRCDGFVIAAVPLGHVGALISDGLHGARVHARGHHDLGAMPKQPSKAGDRPTMVAVSRRHDGDLVLAGDLPQRAMHRPGGTECLERREAKSQRLVLGKHVANAEFGGDGGQGHERRRRIAIEPTMESDGLFRGWITRPERIAVVGKPRGCAHGCGTPSVSSSAMICA